MNIETQIRRTVLSIATFFALGTVALVHGESLAELELDAATATATAAEVACESPDADEAIVVAVPHVIKVDWRASLPATIARSRS